MERKLGEIFTCDGKTYKVIKGNRCTYCDIGNMCILKANIIGPCISKTRTDKTDIVFKEIKDMENNQLTINIPKGMEIDLENSNLAKGIVKFKKKDITYEMKSFDKVLVRNSKSSEWRANLFSHKNIDEPYYCVYASWNYCIPYIGNESLLGTTKNMED